MKYKIYYSATLEGEDEEDLIAQIELDRSLLQFAKSTIIDETRISFNLKSKEDIETMCSLNKINIEIFDSVNYDTIKEVYVNKNTKGIVLVAEDMKPHYAKIIYIGEDEAEGVKCYDGPTGGLVSLVVGEFVRKDLKNEQQNRLRGLK